MRKGAFAFMVQALEEILAKSSRIVFFGGAGVSTESGIPDFRSVDGLYHQKYDYPPETILSHTQRRTPASGKAGKAGQAEGRGHPEH